MTSKKRRTQTFHGMSKTPEYKAWRCMLDRCYNKKMPNYYRYGGAGVKVCKRWRDSFENFFSDMGLKPTIKHSLDRFPNKKGNYTKTNCRWATATEQNNNRVNTLYCTINGKKDCLSNWAKIYNIKYDVVFTRLKKGVDIVKALTTKVVNDGRFYSDWRQDKIKNGVIKDNPNSIRNKILKILNKSDCPLTAKNIIDIISKNSKFKSKIYNNTHHLLGIMVKKGLIYRSNSRIKPPALYSIRPITVGEDVSELLTFKK